MLGFDMLNLLTQGKLVPVGGATLTGILCDACDLSAVIGFRLTGIGCGV